PLCGPLSAKGGLAQAVVHAGQPRQGAAADRPVDGLYPAIAEGEQHAAGVPAAELTDERVVGAQRQREAGARLPAAGLPGRAAAGVIDAAVAGPLADLQAVEVLLAEQDGVAGAVGYVGDAVAVGGRGHRPLERPVLAVGRGGAAAVVDAIVAADALGAGGADGDRLRHGGAAGLRRAEEDLHGDLH